MGFLLILLLVSRMILTVGLNVQLSVEDDDKEHASFDFGGMNRAMPAAVLNPSSVNDIVRLVRESYESAAPLSIAARGHGHSINGQAQVTDGVVIEMTRFKGSRVRIGEFEGFESAGMSRLYGDVWGGELWIDVLHGTLKHGLAPRSWTDYLYLTVGGTLSNAGISGQAFNYGPQISNVYELDVVTGKGELITCSKNQNSELFQAVLGGLGQFGIITRARIALEAAPQKVRWIRVLYSDFSAFTRDQEYLISLHQAPSSGRFDYVEGFVIVDEGLINNWRSSFFSPRNPIKISSLKSNGSVLYCLEMAKNYDERAADTIDQEVDSLLEKLDFIPVSVFTTDLPYIDFLDRVHKGELKLREKGLWEVPHPWLNLFIPKSRISDFNEGVFKGILGKKSSGPILIYPMNRNKWDDRSSVITPDEDIFYLVGFLRSALPNGEETQSLDYLTHQNQQILSFCQKAGIKAKQYLPHYKTQQEWENHYGHKWGAILAKKMAFDPKAILSPGQRIFESSKLQRLFASLSASSSS